MTINRPFHPFHFRYYDVVGMPEDECKQEVLNNLLSGYLQSRFIKVYVYTRAQVEVACW